MGQSRRLLLTFLYRTVFDVMKICSPFLESSLIAERGRKVEASKNRKKVERIKLYNSFDF